MTKLKRMEGYPYVNKTVNISMDEDVSVITRIRARK
jgi:hypothetical protein